MASERPQGGCSLFRPSRRHWYPTGIHRECVLALKRRKRRKVYIELTGVHFEIAHHLAVALPQTVVRRDEPWRIGVCDFGFVSRDAPHDHPTQTQQSRQRLIQVHGQKAMAPCGQER